MPVFCSLLTVSNSGVSSLLLLSNRSGRSCRTCSNRWLSSPYWLRLSIQNPPRSGYVFMTSKKLSQLNSPNPGRAFRLMGGPAYAENAAESNQLGLLRSFGSGVGLAGFNPTQTNLGP